MIVNSLKYLSEEYWKDLVRAVGRAFPSIAFTEDEISDAYAWLKSQEKARFRQAMDWSSTSFTQRFWPVPRFGVGRLELGMSPQKPLIRLFGETHNICELWDDELSLEFAGKEAASRFLAALPPAMEVAVQGIGPSSEWYAAEEALRLLLGQPR